MAASSCGAEDPGSVGRKRSRALEESRVSFELLAVR